ncbi:MAG: class I SAM-dependent methyltransferase [Chitinophagaceae bacterium]|nr:class I SAM-dependent methyltransferase [Chitinophagaceae bacterium]
MTDAFKYQGDELELFQHAKNWKKYFSKNIQPFIKGRVLEVGAGIGATTLLLNNGTAPSWLMLEPDANMSDQLQIKLEKNEFPVNTFLKKGTINNITDSFDTIIYIDVLEHIEADRAELKKAFALLNLGGHIIVLSPAFQFLFNPFDKAIGHFRRYSRKMLKEISPDGSILISNRYYDTVGYFAALVNKFFLRQHYPSVRQVLFWDRWMIPVSRLSDKVFFHSFGKSIIAIWQKTSG